MDYARDVRPLLKAKCVSCHGPLRQKAGLRLDAGKLIHQGGKDAAVIAPGRAAQSEMLARVQSKDPERLMPPSGAALSEDQVALLRRWIDEGAAFPADERIAATPQQHWAFQPVRSPAVPEVKDKAWPLNDIDRFVLARLEAAGLRPNPPAEARVLARRAYLDLMGLPPTAAEAQALAGATQAGAFAALVERLLASPSYGERFERHWLDVLSYADSNGYERDGAKPEVWRYRDYVIRAFNSDKPFDRFLMEQIAGDDLPDADADTVIATGMHRLGPWDDEPADFAVDRFDQLDDIVNTVGQAFLGLTLGCARCHDHKFDPLLQREYYSMVAIFDPLKRPQEGRADLARYALPAAQSGRLRALEQRDKTLAAGQSALQKLDARLKLAPADAVLMAERAAQAAELARLERELPSPPRGYFHYEPSPPAPSVTRVLLRGNPATPGDAVEPAVPAILARAPVSFLAPDAHTTRRRLSLARWMVSADNPLVARVIVNRVWQWHFGEGLVRTPNDFGLVGEAPTHPELLDHLADWFVREGRWSLKKLHAYLCASRTYQMSSAPNPTNAAADAANRLCWRQTPRRLEVEAIRDSMLLVSGRLDARLYGPAMYPFIPPEALAHHADKASIWPAYDEAGASRRTVYAFVKRSLVVPMLEVFDLCDTTRSAPRRAVTTVPTQALTLYNGELTRRQSLHFADRLLREAGAGDGARIRHAWLLALAREPLASEAAAAGAFLEAERHRAPGAPAERDRAALAQLCRVLFNLNEFVYRE